MKKTFHEKSSREKLPFHSSPKASCLCSREPEFKIGRMQSLVRVNVCVHGHVHAGKHGSLTFAAGLSHLFASLPAGSRGDVRRDRALLRWLLLTGNHTTGHIHASHNDRPSNVKTGILEQSTTVLLVVVVVVVAVVVIVAVIVAVVVGVTG